jgi:predicted transcriptional regulator
VVNVNKLKGKIVENGFTIEGFADKLGIDRSTLYRKIGGKCEKVTIKEANQMKAELNLSSEDAGSIFFSHDVA